MKLYVEKYPDLSKVPASYHGTIEKLLCHQVPDFLYAMKSMESVRKNPEFPGSGIYIVFSSECFGPIGLIPIQINQVRVKSTSIIPTFKHLFSFKRKTTRDILYTKLVNSENLQIGPVFHPNYFFEGFGFLKKMLQDMKKMYSIDQICLFLDTMAYNETKHYWDDEMAIYPMHPQQMSRNYSCYYEYCKSLKGPTKKLFFKYQDYLNRCNPISFYHYSQVLDYFTIKVTQTNFFHDHYYLMLFEHLKDNKDSKYFFFEENGYIYASLIFVRAMELGPVYFCKFHVVNQNYLSEKYKEFLSTDFMMEFATKIFYEMVLGNKLVFLGVETLKGALNTPILEYSSSTHLELSGL